MTDSYLYFKNSNINFIQQYEVINLYQHLINKDNELKHIAINENEYCNLFEKTIIPIIEKIYTIYYPEITKSTEEIMTAFYNTIVPDIEKYFNYDDDLKRYLRIENKSEDNIKRDFIDNFHSFLLFFSKLNLKENVKDKLDIRNIVILFECEKRNKTKDYFDYFYLLDTIMEVAFSKYFSPRSLRKIIDDYYQHLKYQCGLADTDKVIYKTLQEIINKAEKRETKGFDFFKNKSVDRKNIENI